MASKLVSLLRKRGSIVLLVSTIGALLSAKGVAPHYGFWDGPG
ncbi:MAG TPA: hypothetical protein VFA19_12625 [Gaiellaceae bacterium]|nr:hypothetical protein [Gaiellaceae bacterium]